MHDGTNKRGFLDFRHFFLLLTIPTASQFPRQIYTLYINIHKKTLFNSDNDELDSICCRPMEVPWKPVVGRFGLFLSHVFRSQITAALYNRYSDADKSCVDIC